MKNIIVFFIFMIFNFSSYSQQTVYSDVIYGGVTGNGGTTAFGSGTINLSIQIPPNSSIKKSFLIAARDSLADDITVVLNGFNYTFDDATIVTTGFNAINGSGLNRPNSSVHMLEITGNIDSSISNYNLTVPPQIGFKGFYSFFYLYIVYENVFLPKNTCNIFFNTQDVNSITNYNLTNLSPITNTETIGLAVVTNYFCDTILDGSFVNVNGNNIGLIGGEDLNSNLWTCAGTYANFSHYNDSLFGLDDDTSDSLMLGTDCLADIKSYVNNGDTAVNVTFTYQSSAFPLTNPIRAVMLSYSTPCDTFTTTITANDTICLGDSVQLQATGGMQYSWFGAFNGLSDTTIANPMAMPTQTTTYICTIKNDSGCVKTEQVKIWVNPLPVADTLMVTNNFCGDSVGSINIGNINSNTTPYSYTLTHLQTGITNSQPTTIFNQLTTNNYQLTITDANGCIFKDTATITETNNVQANFTATPSVALPIAIGIVDFSNTSTGATNYFWEITSLPFDSAQGALLQDSTLNTQYLFNQSGTYETCLIAYNNIPTCADTICKTIIVEDEISFVIPNVFTPNFDNDNDNFVIQLTGASLIKELKVVIFNRWGETVKSQKFKVESFNQIQTTNNQELTVWDGRTTAAKLVPAGTYFYVVSYTLKDDSTSTSLSEHHKKGSVTLLR